MSQESIHIKYLVSNPRDTQWGLTIMSVGMQEIAPDEEYPPYGHPVRYHFAPNKGRVLSEYQLIFLTRGAGRFYSEFTDKEGIVVKEGDMFLLFPGVWHSYRPESASGWTEMWIGFNGQIVEQWHKSGLIDPARPVFHVGVKEEIVSLYRQAMRFADAQEAAFQQMLCGIVCNLLSSGIYYDRNAGFRKNRIQDLISGARAYISSNPVEATPESAAAHVNIGYSKMRKLFKQYTGLTLGQYIAEVRANKAKDLLSNTELPIGEIALKLGFSNEEYFSTYFKRITGGSPLAYRRKMFGVTDCRIP